MPYDVHSVEDKEHRYIETLYGQGYRFNRPVSGVSASRNLRDLPYIGDTSFSYLVISSIRESALLYREGIIAVCALCLSVLPVTITKNRRSVKDILEPWINYAPIIISPGR